MADLPSVWDSDDYGHNILGISFLDIDQPLSHSNDRPLIQKQICPFSVALEYIFVSANSFSRRNVINRLRFNCLFVGYLSHRIYNILSQTYHRI